MRLEEENGEKIVGENSSRMSLLNYSFRIRLFFYYIYLSVIHLDAIDQAFAGHKSICD